MKPQLLIITIMYLVSNSLTLMPCHDMQCKDETRSHFARTSQRKRSTDRKETASDALGSYVHGYVVCHVLNNQYACYVYIICITITYVR